MTPSRKAVRTAAAFRWGLNQRGRHYVVGISTTPTAHPAAAGRLIA
ncbi:hypothetical protein ACFWRV_35625 [Streptomyces sp. NPDC058576]